MQTNYPENKGLSVGEIAPNFDIKDIYGKKILLDDLLDDYDAVLIDFFRGNW